MKNLLNEIPEIKDERITLRRISRNDAASLQELVNSPKVYRYLPTFLFEKKYNDISYVIQHLYDECLEESLILGIYMNKESCEMTGKNHIEPTDADSQLSSHSITDCNENDQFCGIIELYGYREPIHKISIGYRLLERCWGAGIATEALGLLVNYLYTETTIEIITASTMIENQASARVLTKNGFDLVVHAVPEDWGFDEPTITDKWIR